MPTVHQLMRKGRKCKKKSGSGQALRHSYNALTDTATTRYAPQKVGVCTQIRVVKPKKPNSAWRSIARVRLSNRREVTAYIPRIAPRVILPTGKITRGAMRRSS